MVNDGENPFISTKTSKALGFVAQFYIEVSFVVFCFLLLYYGYGHYVFICPLTPCFGLAADYKT